MLKKYFTLMEFCSDNDYSFNTLLTVSDSYYIALSTKDKAWHVGKYTHNKYSYDVELQDVSHFRTLHEATNLISLLIKEPS